MAGLDRSIIRLLTDGSGDGSKRPCSACGRLFDWRTELVFNPRWLADPFAPAVVCQRCLPDLDREPITLD